MSVYFITCRDASAVKIGKADDPRARLQQLQCACPMPLKLEAVFPGGADAESALHRVFDSARIHREWFIITAEIEQYIADSPPIEQDYARKAKLRRRCQISPLWIIARHDPEVAREIIGDRVASGDLHFPFRTEERAA
jgi:hypothetical protein